MKQQKNDQHVFKSDKNQNMYIQNNVWTFYVTLL